MKYKVSVIIPSYNSIDYIDECINSVIGQKLYDIEILCVDAYSIDGTLDVLKKYHENDDRVKIIMSDKKSYGYQINLGIKYAQGEYLGIVESDDYIKEDMYYMLYNKAKEHDFDVVKTDFYILKDNVFTIKKIFDDNYQHLYGMYFKQLEKLDILRNYTINQSGIYKLEFIKKNNILLHESPGASYQDNGFWFQLFTTANSIYFFSDAFYVLRRDNPNSSVYSKEKVYCMCDEYAFIFDIINKNARFREILPYFILKCFHNYMFTLNRIDLKYKRDFVLRFSKDFASFKQKGFLDCSLLGKTGVQILDFIIKEPDEFYDSRYGNIGAVFITKNHLSYKIGKEIICSKEKKISIVSLYLRIAGIYFKHKINLFIYNSICKVNPRLKLKRTYEYPDYEESLRVKNGLYYKTGGVFLKSPLVFLFKFKSNNGK
ncbi:glycosyltransferase family 2 protein [Campylobacter lari]|uniref:glycosyltransferase family 2 protein n=1 Tax=Campylobacter lari TaxID=201 RepID=UPI00057F120C|nr:glycosyltransferase family 2 protein [Campylobacter lari]AJD04380.1 glycosyltransferase, family 2 [Campylobacter lari RM16701]EAK3364914.1 glycosyltransferase family 2 protein [Campylobacter lari]